MDRRKFIKAGITTVAIAMTVPVLFPADTKGRIRWFLVDADSLKHHVSNHLYSMLDFLEIGNLGSCKTTTFTVGGKELEFRKVYEYIDDDNQLIWCKPADYNIMMKMKGKKVIGFHCQYGLDSPYDLKPRNIGFVDGYEVRFMYE